MVWFVPPIRTQAVDDPDLDWAYDQLARAMIGNPVINQTGAATMTGAPTTGSVTLPVAEQDANYSVILSPSGFTGTPAAGSQTITSITPTTTGFTFTTQAAPGLGNTVSFSWFLVRTLTR